MKRSTKIYLATVLLCIAVALVVLGFALTFVAAATGGSLFIVIPAMACLPLGLVLVILSARLKYSW